MGFYTSTGDSPDYADDTDRPDPFDGGTARARRRHLGRGRVMGGDETAEPCGSVRTVREFEGYDQATVWCERTDGPCPWPGTRESKSSERLCATSGARRFSVSWAPACVETAHAQIVAVHDRLPEDGNDHSIVQVSLSPRTLAIARDALAMCRSEAPS